MENCTDFGFEKKVIGTMTTRTIMELGSQSPLDVLNTVAVAIFVVVLVYYLKFWKFDHTIAGLMKFPGPSVWTFVQVFCKRSQYADLREVLTGWKDTYGPRYRVFVGHQFKYLFLTTARDLEVALTHPDLIDKGPLLQQYEPWFGRAVLSAPAEKWKILRKIAGPFFAPRNLRNFHHVIVTEVESLMKAMETKQEDSSAFDIRPFAIRFAYKMALLASTGNATDSAVDGFIEGAKRFSKTAAKRYLKPWFFYDSVWNHSTPAKEQREASALLDTTFKQAIAEGKKHIREINGNDEGLPSTDLNSYSSFLDVLLRKQAEGHEILDDEEILRNILTVAAAGSGSTGSTLSWIFYNLGTQLEEQKILQEEIEQLKNECEGTTTDYEIISKMKKTEAFIYESMRLFPPVDSIERTARKDVQLEDGMVIPAGTMIVAIIGEVSKDPEVFPDPGKFDMTRFYPENKRNRHPYAYLPFSGGPRNCIGGQLAMLEMKTVIYGVLKDFNIKTISSLEEIGCNYYIGLHARNAIKITLQRRNMAHVAS